MFLTGTRFQGRERETKGTAGHTHSGKTERPLRDRRKEKDEEFLKSSGDGEADTERTSNWSLNFANKSQMISKGAVFPI